MISVSIHPSHDQSPSVSWGLGESDIPELLVGDILALCAQLFFLEVSANRVGALRCFAERPIALQPFAFRVAAAGRPRPSYCASWTTPPSLPSISPVHLRGIASVQGRLANLVASIGRRGRDVASCKG